MNDSSLVSSLLARVFVFYCFYEHSLKRLGCCTIYGIGTRGQGLMADNRRPRV